MSRKHDHESNPDAPPPESDTSEAAQEARLRSQSELSAQRLTAGQQTSTTPDSATGETAPAKSVGELDAQTPQERLTTLRGWAKRVKLGGPHSADWEQFDALVGSDEPEPSELPLSGENRRP